jgi:uncharacterized Zn finger protein (UPF0148 family)
MIEPERGASWFLESSSCAKCGWGRFEYWAGDIRCVLCSTPLPMLEKPEFDLMTVELEVK